MNDFIELRQVISNLVRWWWLIALSTIAAGAIGYGISQLQTPIYEANSTLMVGQFYRSTTLDRSDILTSQLLAETYVDMAKSEQVLQAVIENLGLSRSLNSVKKQVKVSRKSDTALLSITVETASPAESEAIAAEIGRQLLLLSPSSNGDQNLVEEKAFLRQRMQNLQAKIEAGQTQLSLLEEGLYQLLPIDRAKELRNEISTLEDLIAGWESRYSQLVALFEQDTSLNSLNIIEPAQASLKPVRPQPTINIIIASLIGFTLVFGVVFLIDFFDSSIKSEFEIATKLGLTPLGSIRRAKKFKDYSQLLTAQDPFSPAMEAYRVIRSNFEFQTKEQPARTIVVTSTIEAPSKSISAANLAIVMAQSGLKTIIVDGDLRQPKQHELFQETNRIGLADLLRSKTIDLKRTLIDTRVDNLQLLPSGTLQPNPAELLGSARLDELLEEVGKLADIVIFDSAPVLPVADTAILASKANGAILVFEAAYTKLDDAQQALNTLMRAKTPVLGAILSRKGKSWQKKQSYVSNLGQQSARAGKRTQPIPKEQTVTFESQ